MCYVCVFSNICMHIFRSVFEGVNTCVFHVSYAMCHDRDKTTICALFLKEVVLKDSSIG